MSILNKALFCTSNPEIVLGEFNAPNPLVKMMGLVQFICLFICVIMFFPSLITYVSFKLTSKKGEKPVDENKVARNCLIASFILFILVVLMGVLNYFVDR